MNNNSAGLNHSWEKYKTLSAISRNIKNEYIKWSKVVFGLGILGAIFGTLAQEFQSTVSTDTGPKILGGLSALCLGLAGYFSKEILNPQTQKDWIRARSMAESIKSQIYLYLSRTSPYDNENPHSLLVEKTAALNLYDGELPTVQLTEEEKTKHLPTEPFGITNYINDRVQDQINNFYNIRAAEYQSLMDRFKKFTWGLGSLAIILGTLQTASGFSGFAVWIAVITTIISSISAYLGSQRYQYLVFSYQATSKRLQSLLASWETQKPSFREEQKNIGQFIMDCEEAISVENSSWMTQLK